jgi:hypothetical protein
MVPVTESEEIQASQVKFHVNLGGAYSVKGLLARTGGSQSLLQKLWVTWRRLREWRRPFTLTLVSDWPWHPDDPLASHIRGADRFDPHLFTPTAPRPAKEALTRWQEALQAKDDDFESFLRALRFRVGFDPIRDLEERVRERMETRGLAHSDAALLTAAGLVGRWVREDVQRITHEILEAAILGADLLAPAVEPAIRVSLHAIERQTYAEPPDFEIDWCEGFGGPGRNAREVSDPGLWNGKFLEDLRSLKRQLNAQPIRLIRARGQARLTVWFALGHTLDTRARYVLEVEQAGQRWRSDAKPTPQYRVSVEDSAPEAQGADVAIAIGVTQDIRAEVVEAVSQQAIPTTSILTLKPSSGVSRMAFGSAGDAVAFAEDCRSHMAEFVQRHQARCAHLFYCGPLSGAAFLGNVVGAAVPEIQLYEDLRPGYAKTFLLHG